MITSDARQRLDLSREKLAGFLRDLRSSSLADAPGPIAIRSDKPAAESLRKLLDDLKSPLERRFEAGLVGSPWQAAGLGRNEIRNSSVLAWFLDPRGRHGNGDRLLRWFLERLSYVADERFPCCPTRTCSVAVESWPTGAASDRVDIEVDDPFFFFIIEVKIDAPEQPEQIRRYCEAAEARAFRRPWAVVFLTPAGTNPSSAASSERVVPISWMEVAEGIRQCASAGTYSPVRHFLAKSFARHVSKF